MMNSVLLDEGMKLRTGQIPIPKPGADQVLIKVHSAPINPSDILFVRGIWGIPLVHPFTPGWEGAGEVIEAGPGQHTAKWVGKRVAFLIATQQMPWKIGGSMAEYVITDLKKIIELSGDISYEQGACSIVNPLSALGMVERLKELKVKACIITAAASQLGRMCIKLCKKEGIEPICTVRRKEQVKLLKAKHVINTSEADWQQKMTAITDKLKPTGCLEAISGEMAGTMMNFLAFGGTLISYGLLSDAPVGNINNMILMGKNLKLEGYLLSHDPIFKSSQEEWEAFTQRAQTLMKSDLQSQVAKKFPIAEFEAAVDFYKKNQTAGKVLIQPALTESVQCAPPAQAAGGDRMMKLYVKQPTNCISYNARMIAEFCRVPLQLIIVDPEMENTKELKDKKGAGAYPFFENSDGTIINQSNAIAAYIARNAGQSTLLGSTGFEEAQVEQWMHFTTSAIVPHMTSHVLHIWGMKDDPAGSARSLNALKDAATKLNTHLNGKSWLVGARLTLADIVVFNSLLTSFTFAFDVGFRKAMPHVSSWFERISKLPFVAKVAGIIRPMGTGQPGKAPAAATGAKQQKGAKSKAAAKEPNKKVPEKKEEVVDDEDDLFGESDEESQAAKQKLMEAQKAQAKKGKKPPPIAKSLVLLEIKPWGPDEDLDALGKKIIAEVKMDGLVWKTEFKKEPVAFTVWKLIMGCVIEDDKVPTDDLIDQITAFEDHVQSVDIAGFNKV